MLVPPLSECSLKGLEEYVSSLPDFRWFEFIGPIFDALRKQTTTLENLDRVFGEAYVLIQSRQGGDARVDRLDSIARAVFNVVSMSDRASQDEIQASMASLFQNNQIEIALQLEGIPERHYPFCHYLIGVEYLTRGQKTHAQQILQQMLNPHLFSYLLEQQIVKYQSTYPDYRGKKYTHQHFSDVFHSIPTDQPNHDRLVDEALHRVALEALKVGIWPEVLMQVANQEDPISLKIKNAIEGAIAKFS